MTEIACEQLCKMFGNRSVINDLSFEVGENEMVGLLGPSGSGKTTLLRMLAGLETPDSGTIILKKAVANNPGILIPAGKRKIGFVFQSPALWPHMTIRQHLEFCSSRQNQGAEKSQNFAKIVEMMAIGRFLQHYPHQLSGGEKQRAAIARSLVTETKILLLDEPFSNIDCSVKDGILSDLQTVRQSCSLTVLYVTHSFEDALAVSDRIVLIREGRIEQQGTPSTLYEKPANLFSARFFGETNIIEGTAVTGGRIATPLGELAAPDGQYPDGKTMRVAIRPSSLSISSSPEGTEGVVLKSSYRGFFQQVTVRSREKVYVIYAENPFVEGERVFIRLKGRYALINNDDTKEE